MAPFKKKIPGKESTMQRLQSYLIDDHDGRISLKYSANGSICRVVWCSKAVVICHMLAESVLYPGKSRCTV
jgi:hypothetical protein